MKQILALLLILYAVPCGLVTAQSLTRFWFPLPRHRRAVCRPLSKEDSAGARQLRVYLAAGKYRDSERIRSEDLTARAFDETGRELEG